MRHEEGAGRASARAVARAEMAAGKKSTNRRAGHVIPGLLCGDGAAGGFLCFPEAALGGTGCCFEDDEELVLVSMEHYHRWLTPPGPKFEARVLHSIRIGGVNLEPPTSKAVRKYFVRFVGNRALKIEPRV